jgi:ABC-type oligopeptide transport system substrate-binding subunit/class 3 adenylate cyclase
MMQHMEHDIIAALAAYIPRDRVEQLLQPGAALPEEGVALIADISGFTPLTEALTRGLSADQGAEELTRALDGVFTPLIAELDAFRGSVIKFGGDALIVWFARTPGTHPTAVIRRAAAAGLRMQRAIRMHGQVPTPIGPVVLRMKVGMAYGAAKRFVLGLPEYGYEDVLGGATLDRMAEAEHHAEPGEVVTDAATLAAAEGELRIAAERDGFFIVGGLQRRARPRPWPPLRWDAAADPAATLRPYVPAQIAAMLAAGRANVAELKPVVSLFVQFHGIDYDAGADVDAQLQEYFATAQRVTARYGGRVNRLITGDKGSLLHIIFGAPQAVEEQEVRAVRCALDLQEACGGLPFISMQRIGMTTGRVFAGPVGAPSRHDYTTMGDSINLSARLMQNAADDQVLIEAGVRAALGDGFDVADLGSIMVKGKSQPIPVFAPMAFRERRQRGVRAAPAMIGRTAELAALRERIGRLAQGAGGVAVITGDVGMGKTLLIDALRAAPGAAVRWADGLCLAYGETLSGYLFIDMLRDLLDLPTGAGPDDASRRLAALCGELFGAARRDATYPYLARFMGLPLAEEDERRLAGLAGESLRWQAFAVIGELLRTLAGRSPLVLALDDLQWADPTSLRLIEQIIPLAADVPLLLLLAMRPERESRAWELRVDALAASGAAALEVTLAEIDAQAAAELVASTAPGLPRRVVAHLVQKGGGNPLFLTELARAVVAQGGDATAQAADALRLPDTVEGLLLAQIDRLEVEMRHTLQMASVIGRSFLYRVLEALAEREDRLDQQLAALEGRAFIQPDARERLDRAFAFRHGLIQESAYGTLLYERRRAYHRQVAETLERLFPTEAAEQAGLLAFHYERADDIVRASAYALQAGDSARLLAANDEAEALYRRALALLERGAADDAGLRARTYLKLAQVRANALDFAGAQEWYDSAFALLDTIDQRAPADVAGAPIREMTLGVFEHGPSTLDPALLDTVGDEQIVQDLFEGLVEIDAELNVVPALARRWHVLEGGLRYRFELRPDLRWSDGAPLTAHDFVFAWRRNLDPATGAGVADLLSVIAGAEAVLQGAPGEMIGVRALRDDLLEVELAAPVAYLLYLLADPIAFPQPAHAYRERGAECFSPAQLVCNGPYIVAEWRAGEEVVLVRNRHYRGIAGNLVRAVLRFIEPTLAHYEQRTIDVCRVEDRADIVQRYPHEAIIRQFLSTYFISFDCARPPFADARVRRAFAQCIDRRALVRDVWADVQKPADGGVIPPGMPGHSPELGLPFDPAAARVLLAEALGGEALPPLTLATLPGTGGMAGFLAGAWREHLGVELTVRDGIPYEEIAAGLADGSISLALVGGDAEFPDPHNVISGFMSGARLAAGWSDAEFDALVGRAAATLDQQERFALYHRADRILVAEAAAIIPLYYYRAFALIRPGFQIAGAAGVLRGGALRLKRIQVTAALSG